MWMIAGIPDTVGAIAAERDCADDSTRSAGRAAVQPDAQDQGVGHEGADAGAGADL